MKNPIFFTCEVLRPQLTSQFGSRIPGRRSKLTKPLFVTPAGVIETFPTEDEQFFQTMPKMPVIPENHPLIPPGSGYSMMTRIDLERSTRYQRWCDGKTEDTRLTLENSYSLFLAGGRDGLKKQFSKSHMFYLLREFKKQGWTVD